MSFRAPHHVVFSDVRTMMLALYYCQASSAEDERKGSLTLFPAVVKEIEHGRWAVPLSSLKDFDRLAKQYGWQTQMQNFVHSGKDVPLSNLVSGEWLYRDPFKPSVKNSQLRSDDLPVQKYDPQSQQVEYLLGVRDDAVAARLLNVLTGYLVQKIRAIPVLADGGDPFKYFWLVAGEVPPLAALLTADRTWWGPVGEGQVSLFMHWPYDFNVSDKLLHRINWGTPGGLVLLSQDAPHVLTLRLANDGKTQRELIEVSDLRPAEVRAATIAPQKNLKQFQVELSLRANSSRRQRSARIKELEREIQAKEIILEKMKDDELIASREPDPLPQPLFIYYPEIDSPASIPRQLQRLIVEWAGLETDLQSLRYLKLSTAGLSSMGFESSFPEAHVLTTAAALCEPDRSPKAEAVGLQLLDYPPMQGEQVWFELLPDWARHPLNLRLFAPHTMKLGLYPQFPANEFASEKLGRALLGSPNLNYKDFVILLLPAPESKIAALRIPIAEFKPLIKAVEWECALDVAPASASVIASLVKTRGEQFTVDMQEAFYGATMNVAGKRLSEMENQLRQELQRQVKDLELKREYEAKRLEARTQMVEDLQKEIKNMNPVFKNLDNGIEQLILAQQQLSDRLESALEISAKGGGLISKLESAIGMMTEARRDLAKSKDELKQWQAKVRQLM